MINGISTFTPAFGGITTNTAQRLTPQTVMMPQTGADTFAMAAPAQKKTGFFGKLIKGGLTVLGVAAGLALLRKGPLSGVDDKSNKILQFTAKAGDKVLEYGAKAKEWISKTPLKEKFTGVTNWLGEKVKGVKDWATKGSFKDKFTTAANWIGEKIKSVKDFFGNILPKTPQTPQGNI